MSSKATEIAKNLPALEHPDGSPIRALVVDDEEMLKELVSMALKMIGWEVQSAGDGPSALNIARDWRPDVLVLDIMMPGFDGLELLNRIRKFYPEEEVMIRLHRLVQRSGVAAIDDAELVVGDLVLNQDTREVTRGGEQINLTATQFDLLRYLMENAKRVVSKSQILDNVWNYDFGGQANIVELYISYLRKKIDVGREPMIHTVRGAGYVLRPTL